MTIALWGRTALGVMLLGLCGAAVPVGSCAKGCGRAASTAGDDVVRTGVTVGDDVARRGLATDDLVSLGGLADDVVRHPGVATGVGGAGADVAAHPSAFEARLASLPEPTGDIAAVVRTPAASGRRLAGLDSPTRSFARDYGRTAGKLELTGTQHEELIDAFDVAQELAGVALEALADAPDTETMPEDGDVPVPSNIGASRAYQESIQLAARNLAARLAEILSPEQLETLRASLGDPALIAYRLGRERPIDR